MPEALRHDGDRSRGKKRELASQGWERFTFELALKLGLPCEEMLARLSSAELTGWLALLSVQADEAAMQRHRLESGDGNVIVTGRDTWDEEDDGSE